MRAVGVLIGLFVVVLILGLLATTFTSAQANLAAAQAVQAQAQASQIQAVSGLIRECYSAAMVIMALVTGIWVRSKFHRVNNQLSGQAKGWVSGPNASWKRMVGSSRQQLTDGDLFSQLLQIELERQQQAILRLPEPESIEEDDDENDELEDYKDWGW